MSLKTKYLTKDLTPEEAFVQKCAGSWNLGCGAARPKGKNQEPILKSFYGCHAWLFSRVNKDVHLVTQYKGISPEEKLFLKWITEPKGPFKKLWEIGEGSIILSRDGDHPVAISLDENQSQYKSYQLIMGLMIISRVPLERQALLKGWYILVTKYGMDEALAYYMSKCVTPYSSSSKINDNPEFWNCVQCGWNGGHEIFNENKSYSLNAKGVVDIKAFSKGDYIEENMALNPQGYYSSVIWNRYNNPNFEKNRLDNFPFKMYSKPIKSGFGEISLIESGVIPKLIKDFTQFVEGRYGKA